MTEELKEFLSKQKSKKFATDCGSDTHKKMQFIIIDAAGDKGDADLINKIKSDTGLIKFFTSAARTEVPIAGIINGKFVSRRIDRLVENKSDKSVVFIDYKTDTDKDTLRDKYAVQMREYKQLLKEVYPEYSIKGMILWLNDFSLEEF